MHHLEMAFYDSMIPREAKNVFFFFFSVESKKPMEKKRKSAGNQTTFTSTLPLSHWIHFRPKGL